MPGSVGLGVSERTGAEVGTWTVSPFLVPARPRSLAAASIYSTRSGIDFVLEARKSGGVSRMIE